MKANTFIAKCGAEELFELKQSLQWEQMINCKNETGMLLPQIVIKVMLNTDDAEENNEWKDTELKITRKGMRTS